MSVENASRVLNETLSNTTFPWVSSYEWNPYTFCDRYYRVQQANDALRHLDQMFLSGLLVGLALAFLIWYYLLREKTARQR